MSVQTKNFVPSVKALRLNGIDLPTEGLQFFDKKAFIKGPVLLEQLRTLAEKRQDFEVSGQVLILGTIGVVGPVDGLVAITKAWEVLDRRSALERSQAKVDKIEAEAFEINAAGKGLDLIERLTERKRTGRIGAQEAGQLRQAWQNRDAWLALYARKAQVAKSLAFADKCAHADRVAWEDAKAGKGPNTLRVRKALAQ